MIIYTLYIEDDRYRVPSLLSMELADDSLALAGAAELLAKSDHYQAIEIWDGDRLVARCARPEA